MADVFKLLGESISTDRPTIRYKDMGDGTWAEVISTEGGGGGGDIEIIPGYDTDGNPLPGTFNTLPQSFAYDSEGNVETITVSDGDDTWVMTFTYVNGNLTADSGWVKQ